MPRPKAFDEAEVLRRVMLLFWRQGYSATGMKEIEVVAGLGASSIYHSFGSKEKLFARVLDEYIERIVSGRCKKHLHADGGLAGIKSYFKSCYQGPQAPFGCLLVNSSVELGPHSKPLAAKIRRGFLIAHNAIVLTLVRAKNSGEIKSTVDVELVARQLGLLMSGMLASGKSTQEEGVLTLTLEVVDRLLLEIKQ